MFAQVVKQGIWQGSALVLIAAVLAFTVNALRDDGLPLRPKAEVKALKAVTPSEIGLQEALARFRTRTALFLDARDAYEFSAGHIPGAWNAPPGEHVDLPGRLQARKDPLIIVYCSDAECTKARKLADELVQNGVSNISIMRQGWLAWSNAGFPVEGNP